MASAPPYSSTVSRTIASPMPWPGTFSSVRTPRSSTRSRSPARDPRAVILDGERQALRAPRPADRAAADRRTRPRHHLQALSSRFPSSSRRSPRSPMKALPGAIASSRAQVLVGIDLQQRGAQFGGHLRHLHRGGSQERTARGGGALELVLDDAASCGRSRRRASPRTASRRQARPHHRQRRLQAVGEIAERVAVARRRACAPRCSSALRLPATPASSRG